MNELTGDREAVLEVMRQTIFHLGSGTRAARSTGMKSLGLTSETKWSAQRDEAVDLLQRAYQREKDKSEQDKINQAAQKKLSKKGAKILSFGIAAPSESVSKDWYMPRDRTVAVFQAAMDEFIEQKTKGGRGQTKSSGSRGKASGNLAAKNLSLVGETSDSVSSAKADISIFFAPKAATPKASLALAGFEKFDNLDPGWVEVVWEKAKSLLKGKAKFIVHKSKTDFRFNIVDKPLVTIALVSDWGGGNDAAKLVGEQIKERQPDHVIHLGDVYYAGTENEIATRFLNLWDFWGGAPATVGRSFALNSNHEMYGGGHGYFKKTLPALRQPASYFSLSNKYWRFIGLDSGYVEHDLNPEQIDWLSGQLTGTAKTVLLSHHQPFSAYADGDPGAKLRTRVQPLFDKFYGWFWGHEHLCAVYGKHLGIKGRCIGHGCLPYEIPTAVSTVVPVDWLDTRKQANGRGMHGFALLTLNNEQMQVEYIDQDGVVAHTESF